MMNAFFRTCLDKFFERESSLFPQTRKLEFPTHELVCKALGDGKFKFLVEKAPQKQTWEVIPNGCNFLIPVDFYQKDDDKCKSFICLLQETAEQTAHTLRTQMMQRIFNSAHEARSIEWRAMDHDMFLHVLKKQQAECFLFNKQKAKSLNYITAYTSV